MSPAAASAVQRQPSSLIVVRSVSGAAELRACQDLQRRAWGITEDGYLLPVATMAGAQRVGGLVLGAFDADDRLVGFAFGFLGRLRTELVLYSQLTGVHPAHQRTGVGRLIKHEQRRRAQAMGLAAVVWAFDPLQASNAAFNLATLGAVCREYEADMYGPRTDTLNAGLPTDRLLAEWPTSSDHVGRTEPWPTAVELVREGESGPELADAIPASIEHARLPIPANIASLKGSGGFTAAQQWQAVVRAAFQRAFADGFVAVGFDRTDPDRPRYLLERRR
jgi:predicted GNAT superfamily acetyltransferase